MASDGTEGLFFSAFSRSSAVPFDECDADKRLIVALPESPFQMAHTGNGSCSDKKQ